MGVKNTCHKQDVKILDRELQNSLEKKMNAFLACVGHSGRHQVYKDTKIKNDLVDFTVEHK